MRRNIRTGYTLFEILVILVLLIILGAAILPTMNGFYSNTRQRSAADTVRSRLADARVKAMERGQAFRVAVHIEKNRIRLGPDGEDFASRIADDPPALDSLVTEDKLDPATAEVVVESGVEPPFTDAAGWVTIATFLPDGTCREGNVVVAVREQNFQPILIQVRGVTGSTRVLLNQPKGGTP